MANNQEVRFIRRNGRIVPIRAKKKEKRNDVAFGAKTAAAGLVVPAVTSRLSNKLREKAGKANTIFAKTGYSIKRVQTRKFVTRQGGLNVKDLFRRSQTAEKIFEKGMKAHKSAQRLNKAAPFLKSAGIWTGASLIGSGLARMFETKKESNASGTAKELGFTAASAAAIYGSGDAALRAKSARFLRKLLTRGK